MKLAVSSLAILLSIFLPCEASSQTAMHKFSYSHQSPGRGVDGGVDFNGDMVKDILVGGNSLTIYSGYDGSVLASFPHPTSATPQFDNVAFLGDLNGDGKLEIMASNSGESTGASLGGAAYIFNGAYNGSGTPPAVFRSYIGTFIGNGVGQAITKLSDIDGDNVLDYAISVMANNPSAPTMINIYSGATGVNLATIPGLSGIQFGYDIFNAGNMDGDGIDDLIVGIRNETIAGAIGSGRVNVYSSLMNWGLMHTFTSSSAVSQPHLGETVGSVGDLNGDTFDEILFGSTNDGAYLYSGGLTPTLLSHITGAPGFGFRVRGLGDTNLDGKKDFAIVRPNIGTFIYSGLLPFVSGQPQLLSTIAIPFTNNFITAVAPAGDSNNDNKDDFVIAYNASSLPSSEAQVVSLTTLAAVSYTTGGFTGCGNASNPQPLLNPFYSGGINLMKLGQSGNISGGNLPFNSTGSVYITLIPPSPTPLAPQCVAYLDLATAFIPPSPIVGYSTGPSSGSWTVPFALPSIPSLAGLQLVLQAGGPSSNSLGFYLTNPVYYTLGY